MIPSKPPSLNSTSTNLHFLGGHFLFFKFKKQTHSPLWPKKHLKPKPPQKSPAFPPLPIPTAPPGKAYGAPWESHRLGLGARLPGRHWLGCLVRGAFGHCGDAGLVGVWAAELDGAHHCAPGLGFNFGIWGRFCLKEEQKITFFFWNKA